MLNYKEYPEMVFNESGRIQIIEIDIPNQGGQAVFDTDSLTAIKDIIGIAIINPTPKSSGHGTLQLHIGDEEILPDKFHADILAKYSKKHVDTELSFGFKHYIFPVNVKAEGRPIKVNYREPDKGNKGKLYLFILGSLCGTALEIPKFRFQVIEFSVPKGDNSADIELLIKERTLQSHKTVIGALLLGMTNRIKKASLAIDGTTVFPSGMISPLVTKELPTPDNLQKGIYARHIVPLKFLVSPLDIKAGHSEIEGSIVATPNPTEDYSIYLYLLTTS